jgi:hypothetical protein
MIMSYSMRCGYEVTGTILLQAYLYTYSLLRGIVFNILTMRSYALSPVMAASVGNFFGTPVVE